MPWDSPDIPFELGYRVQMSAILITGGHGQLGRALEAALTADEVTALAHSELDITDREQVSAAVSRHEPEVVIHAAAWTDTAGCERDPARALLVNGDGAGIVAEACRESGATMLYISTNEVFDGEKSAALRRGRLRRTPSTLTAARSSKASVVCRRRSNDHCIVRTSWLYGPGRDSFPEKILDRRATAERTASGDRRNRFSDLDASIWRTLSRPSRTKTHPASTI